MLMDEPFSAVDPVVREQLQDEFLRLQGELGKTIVFVTHDIDEAIKLGDQVAVLRVGGRLAQVAEPAYLLAHPADDFVADFVGRDRGYRALQFQDAPRLPLRSEPTVVLGESPDRRDAAWLLVVDDDRRPLGWVEPARIGDRAVTEADLHRGGTVRASTDPSVGHSTPPCPRRAGVGRRRRQRRAVRHGARATRCSPRSRRPSGPSATRRTRTGGDVGAAEDALTWLADNWRTVLDLARDHLYLAGVPLVIGLVLSLPLGWAAKRWSRSYPAIITTTGLLYTIPSLALFVIMPIVLGTKILDPVNVVVAMTIYTVALLVRTVADGLQAVPDHIEQAATAMGYKGVRRLFGVELPLAVPGHRLGPAGRGGEQRQHRQRRLAHRGGPARRPARRRLQPGHLG